MSDWHGWAITDGGAELHIGTHPYRKSVALMAHIPGYGLEALGYFRSERDARLALGLLDALVERSEGKALAALSNYTEAGGMR